VCAADGRRSSPDNDAEHVLDAMPALDLKPVRVRRPGSSSKMHTQGQLRGMSDPNPPACLTYPQPAQNHNHTDASLLTSLSHCRSIISPEPLSMDDDWSSPEKGRTVASPALHQQQQQQHGGYNGYGYSSIEQQPYSSASYQQEAYLGARGDSSRQSSAGMCPLFHSGRV
jgi:hypothetical protein